MALRLSCGRPGAAGPARTDRTPRGRAGGERSEPPLMIVKKVLTSRCLAFGSRCGSAGWAGAAGVAAEADLGAERKVARRRHERRLRRTALAASSEAHRMRSSAAGQPSSRRPGAPQARP
jgi:hypothetical protein